MLHTCCKNGITIDNHHVTNITAKVQISPQTTKRKHRKNHKPDVFSWFGLPSSSLPILYFCQCCHFFNSAHFPLHYILRINKENIPQIDIQSIFKCDFCSFLAKIELKSQYIYLSLVPYRMDVPALGFDALPSKELSLLPSWMGIIPQAM